MSVWANFTYIYYGECVAEVYKVERNSELQCNSSLSRCEKTWLTSPLEYKYRVIFVSRFGCMLFVLYEVQLDNRESWSNKAAMYKMQRGWL